MEFISGTEIDEDLTKQSVRIGKLVSIMTHPYISKNMKYQCELILFHFILVLVFIELAFQLTLIGYIKPHSPIT